MTWTSNGGSGRDGKHFPVIPDLMRSPATSQSHCDPSTALEDVEPWKKAEMLREARPYWQNLLGESNGRFKERVDEENMHFSNGTKLCLIS